MSRVKLTAPLERVLRVFLADVSARHYGYDLMKAAKLPSGTLYPMLARLQDQGLVASQWEPQPDDAAGRPPRKYYQLTGEGVRVARLELAQAASTARGAAARRVPIPGTLPVSLPGATRPAPGTA
jgi:DNA-binding PadR family transcriptional regulator